MTEAPHQIYFQKRHVSKLIPIEWMYWIIANDWLSLIHHCRTFIQCQIFFVVDSMSLVHCPVSIILFTVNDSLSLIHWLLIHCHWFGIETNSMSLIHFHWFIVTNSLSLIHCHWFIFTNSMSLIHCHKNAIQNTRIRVFF